MSTHIILISLGSSFGAVEGSISAKERGENSSRLTHDGGGLSSLGRCGE